MGKVLGGGVVVGRGVVVGADVWFRGKLWRVVDVYNDSVRGWLCHLVRVRDGEVWHVRNGEVVSNASIVNLPVGWLSGC